MIRSTIKYRNKLWYLHSYVYGKEAAAKIARSIRNTCKSRVAGGTYGGSKQTHVVHKSPEPGEKTGKYVVYWRYKE